MTLTLPERFYGTVQDGKPTLDNRKLFDAYLKRLEGERFELTVGPIPNKRSDRQNRYVQRTVRIFAQTLGMDHDQCRHALCGKYFGWVPSPIDSREIPAKTTSQCTVEEMSEFISWLPVFGMEMNIIVPLPNEEDL